MNPASRQFDVCCRKPGSLPVVEINTIAKFKRQNVLRQDVLRQDVLRKEVKIDEHSCKNVNSFW